MLNKLIVTILASAVATSAWTAESERASRHEVVGLGGGAAIGAAAGGPVGLILGAALGSWVGDRFHAEYSGRLVAEAAADAKSADVERLSAELDAGERDVARLEATLLAAEASHRTTLEEVLEIEVYFRTAESTLNGAAEERLTRIAELIAGHDDIVVLLEGHADARGDATYNEELSAQRAAAVQSAFISAGVPEERIAVTAEGERQALAEEKDLDALALDRRVAISLVPAVDAAPRVALRDER